EKARKAAVGKGGLHDAIAVACGVARQYVFNILSERGQHVEGNRIVAKPFVPDPPASPPVAAASEPDDTGHAPSTMRGRRERDDDDALELPEDAAEPRFTADTPGYSPPRPTGDRRHYFEVVADAVDSLRQTLEQIAESVEGRALIEWVPLGSKD